MRRSQLTSIFYFTLVSLLPVSASAYWRVTSVAYLGNLNGVSQPFSFPEQYVLSEPGLTTYALSQNVDAICYGGGSCDTTGGFGFKRQFYCPYLPCGEETFYWCGLPPNGWDAQSVTVAMPLASSSYQFRNPADSVYYRYAMFHMSQDLGCGRGAGLYGSIGIDFGNSGFNWSEYPANPVLTDTTWSSVPLSLSPGSSVEKGSVVWYEGFYYMMAIVGNPAPGYENSITCANTNSSLTYLLSSSDGVSWSKIGMVSSTGLVDAGYIYGRWLINVTFAYHPPSGDVYMTRSYKSVVACGGAPFGTLPDRVQVYRVANGISGVLNGPWQLLIDLGCNSDPAFLYQQSLNFAPDSAQIRHNGLGWVVFNAGEGLTLTMSNGNLTSCHPGAPIGIYEVTIFP